MSVTKQKKQDILPYLNAIEFYRAESAYWKHVAECEYPSVGKQCNHCRELSKRLYDAQRDYNGGGCPERH